MIGTPAGVTSEGVARPGVGSRRIRSGVGPGPFRLALLGLAAIIPLVIVAVLLFLLIYAWPAIRFNGLGFLFTKTWDLGNLYADPVPKHGVLAPIGAQYGSLVFVAGTLLSSGIALLIAVPVSLGISIFLAEGVGAKFRTPFAIVVEMLAVVPSVVYGLWGVTVLVPLVAHVFAPAIAAVLGFIPFFGASGGGGFGLLAASLVLALMVIPIITITVYDALTRVPREAKEAAYALGTTKFEMVSRTMLPMVRPAIIGAVILGLGRALGETMAVLMVSGGALNYLPHSIMSPISTMASFILSQLDSAEQDPSGLAVQSLAEIAIVLFVITVLVNAVARLLVRSGSNARG
ncbi:MULTISPECIES: phosphate ABC transporter permease subunit PstC [unclassified Acidisoma]|jgi:phosphate transport system permease protein|uniref:phosphate ABC transporter permease subunit PstC n=1 Tax=unclassified Acidisoma TaxID=2634065 RepID=UPI00131B8A55|nr:MULTISPECIES: phosphate ABC transporter permease subunit PstC [unclassified Acidisoma]